VATPIFAFNEGVESADSYTIKTVVPYAKKEPEVKEYTVSLRQLNQFIEDQSQTAEIVVDIRPGDGDE